MTSPFAFPEPLRSTTMWADRRRWLTILIMALAVLADIVQVAQIIPGT